MRNIHFVKCEMQNVECAMWNVERENVDDDRRGDDDGKKRVGYEKSFDDNRNEQDFLRYEIKDRVISDLELPLS